MNMDYIRKLPLPEEIKEQYPVPNDLALVKAKNDEDIKKIFTGEDDRFLLIIGPCSADREDAVLEYVSRLKKLQEKVSDVIYMIPRVYTNKPRTNGEGYKGMLHQPNPQGKSDMLKGILTIRDLHLKVLKQTGFSTADEMLYPGNYQYLDDLLSYVAVGARSVENQEHRLVASGMDVPAGMKNPTAGDLTVMLNSIHAAQKGHTFIYRGYEVSTHGNPLAHAILRGHVNSKGQSFPNYHYEDLLSLAEEYDSAHFENPAVIVDCNHSNSGKKFEEQIRIAKEVVHSMRHNSKIMNIVKGLMIESYLVDGSQKVEECVYGKSITDPCLGWEKTEQLVIDLAEIIRGNKGAYC